jgi:hypothetical protein
MGIVRVAVLLLLVQDPNQRGKPDRQLVLGAPDVVVFLTYVDDRDALIEHILDLVISSEVFRLVNLIQKQYL